MKVNDPNRKAVKLLSMIVVIMSLFVLMAFSCSAAMDESEMKSRLSSYSSWFSGKEKDVFTVTCPAKDVSDDTVFSHVNKITSLLKGELVEDYCEITLKFPYSEDDYASFDAFTVRAFTLEDKLKSFWTNWSETNQMDVVCNYTYSSAKGTVYTTNIKLKLNGSDPDRKISKYDEKLMQIVNAAKKSCSTKMELVQYYCNWLDTNVKYSLFYQYTNSPYYALMSGRGVCGSYANALKDMCELSGIPAIVPVNQYELNHAWNEVYVNGKWYTVDLCYVVEPSDGKYNGFCFANPNRKKFPVDHYTFIEKHKAEYVSSFETATTTNINTCTVPSIGSVTYTGSAIKPAFTVKYGSSTLKEGVHYTVSYSSNTSVGKAKITIKGIPSAGYTGTKTVYFYILPGKVQNCKSSSYEKQIKLSWSAVKGATGYRVYLYDSKAKKYTTVTDFTQDTSVTIKKLKSGTKYKFAVKAYSLIDSKVRWAKSYVTHTTATKTDMPTVKASQTATSITLKWNKVSGATGYKVYRYNSKSGKWKRLTTTQSNTYTIKKLTAGTGYTFAVRAYITVGSTELLSKYERFTTATKASAPTVTLKAASQGKVAVKWNAVKGATGYQVYCSSSKTGDYKKLSNVKASPYTASLTKGKTYYIKVRAYTKTANGNVYGSFSTVKSVKAK